MAYIRDMSQLTYNNHSDNGRQCISVGWLGEDVPREGVTDTKIALALIACKHNHQLPDHWRGLHTCQLCHKHHEKGEFFVDGTGDARYILPNMVTHYVEAHGYRLPVQVETALTVINHWIATKGMGGR